MSRLSHILFTILILWFISYAASSFVKTDFRDKIAVIPIEGTIIGSDLATLTPATTIKSHIIVDFINQANEDDTIQGILLLINSPGGTVVASKEIVQAVKDSPKPVVAYIREIGTSGAYWIASASDHIVADELSLTGSIGVVSTFLEFSGLMEEYGITYEGLKTGKYKDVGSPFRQMTEEERTILLGKMQKIHDVFVSDVAANRDLDQQKITSLANGIYYLGSEAVTLGLIDELGSKALALNRTKELAAVEDAVEIEFRQTRYLSDILGRLSAFSFYHLGRGMGQALFSLRLEDRTPVLL